MSKYATVAQYLDWTDHLDVDTLDTEGIEKLLARAEADVEHHTAWPWPTSGPRIPVAVLSESVADALARAVVVQASYRQIVTEDSMVEGVPNVQAVDGPGGVTFARTAPERISPEVKVILAASGLVRRSPTVR